jgi:hypothetical protein
MKVVYVIAPYRAARTWDIEQNIRKAEEAALMIVELGAMPLCVHSMTRFFNGTGSDRFWLDGTMELMRRSDACYALASFVYSQGGQAEVQEAQKLKMPLFYEHEQWKLAEWIAKAPQKMPRQELEKLLEELPNLRQQLHGYRDCWEALRERLDSEAPFSRRAINRVLEWMGELEESRT